MKILQIKGLKMILTTIIGSALLLSGLIYWQHSNLNNVELKLDSTQEINGPLTALEQTINNPNMTNTTNPIAIFETSQGTIKLELFADQMPITTGNFIELAKSGFYNGTKFHRVIDGFMIQGGDPNSKGTDETLYGTGGPDHNVADEFVEGELLTNTRGTIAMANTGQPNSGGSQWFINLVDNTALDFNKAPFTSKHPVFGRVVEGMNVVDAIGQADTKERDIPATPIVIESITIFEGE